MGIKSVLKEIISTPTERGEIKKKNNTKDKTPFSIADRAEQIKERKAKIDKAMEE